MVSNDISLSVSHSPKNIPVVSSKMSLAQAIDITNFTASTSGVQSQVEFPRQFEAEGKWRYYKSIINLYSEESS